MICIEDLGINGYKIFQDDRRYRFTSDAVLLSRFATVKKNDTVADFCSGCGIVGIHLFALNPSVKSVALFEMQEELYGLSVKSIEHNDLKPVFTAYNIRIQDIDAAFDGKFSLIVCNPPYLPAGNGFDKEQRSVAICTCEITVTLREIIAVAAKKLKFGGRLAVSQRADRLADVFCFMRDNCVEPKRIAFVKGSRDKEPYLVLAEGVKGGKPGLKILKPFVNGE